MVIPHYNPGDFHSIVLSVPAAATSTDPVPLITDPGIKYRDVNIQHTCTKDLYYGNGAIVQNGNVGAGAAPNYNCTHCASTTVLTYQNVRAETIYFKHTDSTAPACYVLVSGVLE